MLFPFAAGRTGKLGIEHDEGYNSLVVKDEGGCRKALFQLPALWCQLDPCIAFQHPQEAPSLVILLPLLLQILVHHCVGCPKVVNVGLGSRLPRQLDLHARTVGLHLQGQKFRASIKADCAGR